MATNNPLPTREVVFKKKPEWGVVKINAADFDSKLHADPKAAQGAPPPQDDDEVTVEVPVRKKKGKKKTKKTSSRE